MAVQMEGNKIFYCPACDLPTRVSVLIGMQSYICLRTRTLVPVEEQIASYQKQGWAVVEGGKEQLVNGVKERRPPWPRQKESK